MSHRILVVDDEPDLRLLARMILQTAGWAVVEAETGEAALSMMEPQAPDLVLLDLRLPGIDGWEVLETIRSSGTLERVPVIMISAQASAQTQEKALELGCSAFLAKPFSPRDLMDLIDCLLSKDASPRR